ncbi:MAG TPA: Rieske 2Fe-2S domain-containing protein [Dehalococcoidia bacterium]|jgi:cytochrome b6-f complex iron-sulfur subunit|nr:Rieske 2Fe-2S domain-containing protein [Dehalococcoidia bacterium]
MPDEENAQPNEAEKNDESGASSDAATPKTRAVAGDKRAPAAANGGGAIATPQHAVVVAKPAPVGPPIPTVSRRGVLRVGFWAGMGVMLAAIGTTIVYALYPRRTAAQGGQQRVGTSEVSPFGGVIPVGKLTQFDAGKPVHNLDARAWIMKFDEERAARERAAGNKVEANAILALYHKCVHLGCTVPWKDDFTWTDDRPGVNKTYSGWFRCPCHGSTYTYGGVRVFGPAPRSLDTFDISVSNGTLMVNTGKITLGDTTDSSRAKQLG